MWEILFCTSHAKKSDAEVDKKGGGLYIITEALLRTTTADATSP